jgi:putative flippase GtrA
MIFQYIKFFINGGVLGIAAVGLQWMLYEVLGNDSVMAYSLAAALTYMVLIVINFLIQRTWIFNHPGLFWRFVVANLAIMILVSLLSPLCRYLIDQSFGSPWGDRVGFIAAALFGSIPSFFLQRIWVFGVQLHENSKKYCANSIQQIEE